MKLHTELHLEVAGDEPQQTYSWERRHYSRIDDGATHGPASFAWDERQLADLQSLFSRPDSDGPRERLAADMGALLSSLAWRADTERLEDADERGEELLFTVRADPPELYSLPWETLRVDASGTYLSDFHSALVRYAVPGLRVRDRAEAPAHPGVTFAWSSAGGRVPRDAFVDHIQAACERAGVVLHEIPDVDQGKLDDALEANPTSVLHILCHGLAGAPGEPPKLAWGGTEPVEVPATRLARMLRPYRKDLRLVILSACGSGDGGGDALFLGSLAQELHKKGIENVVASRSILSVAGARRMSESLYASMLDEGRSLERSVREARATLLKAGPDGSSNAGDAYALQLYTHAYENLPDGEGTRPVMSSYPFGIPPSPAPKTAPPRGRVQLILRGLLKAVLPLLDRLTAALRRAAEDETLKIEETRPGSAVLYVDTTIDGGQRLFQSWRAGVLAPSLGQEILDMRAWPKPIPPPPPAGGNTPSPSGGPEAAAAAKAGVSAGAGVSVGTIVGIGAAVLVALGAAGWIMDVGGLKTRLASQTEASGPADPGEAGTKTDTKTDPRAAESGSGSAKAGPSSAKGGGEQPVDKPPETNEGDPNPAVLEEQPSPTLETTTGDEMPAMADEGEPFAMADEGEMFAMADEGEMFAMADEGDPLDGEPGDVELPQFPTPVHGYWTFDTPEEAEQLWQPLTLSDAELQDGLLLLAPGGVATALYTGPAISDRTLIVWLAVPEVGDVALARLIHLRTSDSPLEGLLIHEHRWTTEWIETILGFDGGPLEGDPNFVKIGIVVRQVEKNVEMTLCQGQASHSQILDGPLPALSPESMIVFGGSDLPLAVDAALLIGRAMSCEEIDQVQNQ